MKSWTFYIAMLMAPAALVAAAPLSPIAPRGPCPDVSLLPSAQSLITTHQIIITILLCRILTQIAQAKVDAILKGEMDPSECCSYGKCKGDVVVSVG